ncbi:unnamed protein product [Peniophora sp. CBMAI 1063]|nr:unnamed protein product [Peniophora sp. CBMAI 1063]
MGAVDPTNGIWASSSYASGSSSSPWWTVSNTIVWSDNGDVRLYAYCDIVSRVQMMTYAVKPMATLLISRRLYLIASLQSVELPSNASRYRDMAIEWTLGLLIPLLVAGPIYYVNQSARFQVAEGFGCTNATDSSIFYIIVIQSFNFLPALLSLTIYYPRVARIFYLRRRDVNRFLRSNTSVSRTNYFRLLSIASLDILLTLPFGLVSLVLKLTSARVQDGSFPFYPGWSVLHEDWTPSSVSYAQLKSFGASTMAASYFTIWTSPVLSFFIFAFFGLTSEARTSYRHLLLVVGSMVGWKPARVQNAHSTLGTMEFGTGPQGVSDDVEPGSLPSDPYIVDPVKEHEEESAITRSDLDAEKSSEFRRIPTDEDRRQSKANGTGNDGLAR